MTQVVSELMHSPTNSARKIIPHFPSKSIPSTIRFYSQVLHFHVGEAQYTRGKTLHPTFCSVYAGEHANANIYFFLTSESDRKLSPGNIMIAMSTDGLEEYYTLLKREGKVEFVEEIEDKEWGYRQFEIVDEDGSHIQFFRFLEDESELNRS
jgi:uncharacterized glyoxalase superfamily protein PhnB